MDFSNGSSFMCLIDFTGVWEYFAISFSDISARILNLNQEYVTGEAVNHATAFVMFKIQKKNSKQFSCDFSVPQLL